MRSHNAHIGTVSLVGRIITDIHKAAQKSLHSLIRWLHDDLYRSKNPPLCVNVEANSVSRLWWFDKTWAVFRVFAASIALWDTFMYPKIIGEGPQERPLVPFNGARLLPLWWLRSHPECLPRSRRQNLYSHLSCSDPIAIARPTTCCVVQAKIERCWPYQIMIWAIGKSVSLKHQCREVPT